VLDATLKAQLAGTLEHLKRPIRISASLDGSAASAETRALLADIAAASSRMSVALRPPIVQNRPRPPVGTLPSTTRTYRPA